MNNDEQILHLLSKAKNKELAFKMLMDVYQRRLYHHIKRLVVSHENTDDVLQETMVKVYFALDQYKGNSRLYTWLYSIATNECWRFLDVQNKRKWTNECINTVIESSAISQSSPNADQLLVLLEKAVFSLPLKQQLVFNLRYYDDLPYEEIAIILKCSESTCKTNYHYAKQKITDFIYANSEEIQTNG